MSDKSIVTDTTECMLISVSLKYMYMDLISVIFKLMGKDKKMESMQSNFSDISSSKQETSSSRVGKLLMVYVYKSLLYRRLAYM